MTIRQVTLTLAAGLSLSALQAAIPAFTDTSKLNKSTEQQSSSDAAYRTRVFHAYLPLEELRKQYKVGNYSAFENPTGIYFQKGEKAFINLDKNAKPGDVKLIVHDFGASGAHEVYPLNAGVNQITMKSAGLAYVDYRSMKPKEQPPVMMKIQGGTVNGIFTHHDDAATWKRLLAGASCEMIDMVGERVQLVYHVAELRKHTPDKGVELLKSYDEIIKHQQDLMGWERFIHHPGNHILGRNIWRGFMHADGMGAAFHHNTMGNVGSAEKLPKSSWGVAHEFGHVNQVRPAMTWVGTTEITNNIFSAVSNFKLNSSSMRLEHENTPSPNGNMRGGRFHSYINSAIVDLRPWQFQQGPDSFNYGKYKAGAPAPSMKEEIKASSGSYDHFVNVAPLWQLYLYMDEARGLTHFYPSIFQKVRQTDDSKLTHGQMRMNFMKNACDASKLNLTRFFALTRMLAPLNRMKNDYSSRMLTITPEMLEDFLRHAQQYPEPDSKVIYYINSNNVGLYKNKTPLVKGDQLMPSNGKITVPAGQWSGAVAFEVRKGKKIVSVSLLGLGHDDNVTTDIFVPADADSVMAVSWDGQRESIYRKK